MNFAALVTASLHLLAITGPAAVDPFAADPPPAPVVDPLDTSVPSPEGDAWTPPPPPPLPPPPPPQATTQPLPRRYTPPDPADDPQPTALASPEDPPADPGKRTIFAGVILVGGGVVAGIGSIYAWREHSRREDSLAAQQQLNDDLMLLGSSPVDTSELASDVKLYRGLTIGFGVTAGVLALVGGVVVLAGVGQRRRASRLTLRPAGLEVRF